MKCRDGNALHRRVRRWTSSYSRLWFNAPGNLPLFLRPYSRQEQSERERRVNALKRTSSFFGKNHNSSERARGRAQLMAFIAQGIPGKAGTDARQFLERCGRAGEKFVARARAFDRGLSDTDIQQALRNFWVFNSIQEYLGKPVSLTPSSFAYSLLYPYTDNWLDQKEPVDTGGQALLPWLSSQLCGRPVPPDDPRKERIAALLAMIRTEHPRSPRSDVHQSLLAIHRAQKNALALVGAASSATEHCLIPLTIEKGGTSVLVDGLLAGHITDVQAEAIFGYGVLLQLVDDLQDLQEDVEGGTSTPFSRAIRHGTLEGITNRLFNLAGSIASLLQNPESPRNGHLPTLVERSCMVLIQEAIARHSNLYRKGYLTIVNRHTPVSLAYLRALRSR